MAPAGVGRHGLTARAVLGGLRAYKLALSPLFAGSCRYLPTCSDYMAEAVMRHGALRGVWLGLCRLTRCHPFGSSGHDPVPIRLSREAQLDGCDDRQATPGSRAC